MNFRRILYILCLTPVLVRGSGGQVATESDDVEASLKSCRVVQMTVSARERMRASGDVPGDDDFTAAAKACGQLNSAISASAPDKIEAAAKQLRPLLSRLGLPPSSPKEQLAALERKTAGMKGRDLFYNLAELSRKAFNAGEIEKAQAYSEELLRMALQYPKDWNYGNAIFYGNLIMGRISVKRGNLKQADQYLLAAGSTPGSPQLDSFGPNMTLAKELLERNHSSVVLQYFALCKKFWEDGHRQLDDWSVEVRSGGVPNFGSNLNY